MFAWQPTYIDYLLRHRNRTFTSRLNDA